MAMRNPFRSKTSWIIFFAALVVRSLHLLAIRHDFLFQYLLEDSLSLDHYAAKLAAGTLKDEIVLITLSPAYFAFLAFFYSIFGHLTLVPRLAQILLGSLSCVLIYKTGKMMWGKKTARIAGWAAALCGVFVFYDAEILKPSFANFVGILFIFLMVYLSRKPSIGIWVISGIVFGTFLILRMNVLLTLPFILFWIFWTFRSHSLKKALLYAVLFVGVLSMTWAGWKAWYEHAVPKRNANFKETGVIFYIGNHEGSGGTYKRIRGVRASARGHNLDARKIAEKAIGRPINEKEMNAYWMKKAFEYIKKNPGEWIELEFKKLFLVLNNYEIPNSENFYYAKTTSWVLKFPLLTFGIIAPLGFIGILFASKKEPGPLFLILFMIPYALSLIIMYVTSAYRMPLYPPLILFAAYGLVRWGESWRENQRRLAGIATVVFILAFMTVNYESHLNETRYNVRTQRRVAKAKKIVKNLQFMNKNPQSEDYLRVLRDI